LYIRNDVVSKVWDYQAGAISAGTGGTTQTVKLTGPTGIAFTSNGERFVVDHKANRVARIDVNGSIVSTFGSFGSDVGKFNDAWGIAVDSGGNIYVADTFNHRIEKFDPQGNFLFSWGTPGVSTAPGSGRTTIFFGPRAIAIDKQGRLYVTDTGNKRVQVFDGNGNYITQFGTSGTSDGQFNEPVGIAIDQSGNIYVADTWNHRIQVFDANYKFVRAWTVTAWQQMDQNELQSVDHKPYLAINGNTIFVSSPKTQQVFAYTLEGQSVSLPNISFSADSLPTGLAIYNNTLYVTNASGGPILQFVLSPG
jgi:DNA-binding beta-propeller fold protein YncE